MGFPVEQCVLRTTQCLAAVECFTIYQAAIQYVMERNTTFNLTKDGLSGNITQKVSVGPYWNAMSSAVSGSFFLTGLSKIVTTLLTSALGAGSLITEFGSRLNERKLEAMTLPKWFATNVTFNESNPLGESQNPFPIVVTAPPPKPVCNVYIYWTASCGAIGSHSARNCSDGGSLVHRKSCRTHFHPASSKFCSVAI